MSFSIHSLRWRLQAWHGLILLVVVAAFCLTAYRFAASDLDRRIGRDLSRSERHLMEGIFHTLKGSDSVPHPLSRTEALALLGSGAMSLPGDILSTFSGNEPGYRYFCVYGPEGEVLLRSDNVPDGLVAPGPSTDERDRDYRTVGLRRELVRRGPDGLAVLVGYDTSPDRADRRRLAWSLGGLGCGVWLLGLVGGWWLAGRAIKPIAAISSTASQIADGQLEERISVVDTDSELGQLAGVLNRTFDELQTMLEQQRRFTSDASHELRTPITLLLAETDRVLRRERSAEEYRAAVETCREGAQRMRSLVEALLTLTRQENATAAHETCDLAEIAAKSVDEHRALAEEHGLRVDCELGKAPCVGDPAALGVLVDNLIGNALRHHGGAEGTVTVRTDLLAEGAALVVRDDGVGIPPEAQAHIFDRFYRVDKARTGGSSHLGLGLSIVQAIADKHGAVIELKSAPGEGSAFTVRFPTPSGA